MAKVKGTQGKATRHLERKPSNAARPRISLLLSATLGINLPAKTDEEHSGDTDERESKRGSGRSKTKFVDSKLFTKKEEAGDSVRENSVLESFHEMLGGARKSKSQEEELKRDLFTGCKAKFYIQPSVEIRNGYVGSMTFLLHSSPDTFLHYVCEQAFGRNLTVLEEISETRRIISTSGPDEKQDFVLDQVIHRVSSSAVFIGIKSCKVSVWGVSKQDTDQKIPPPPPSLPSNSRFTFKVKQETRFIPQRSSLQAKGRGFP